MRALVVLLVAAALAGCGGSESGTAPATTEAAAGPETETTAQTETAGATVTAATTETAGGTVTAASARVSGTTLDGTTVSLDDFRGKPVLLNVWSAW